jgi:1,4-dihydroxy-2-naphthoate octaprenyltransferase
MFYTGYPFNWASRGVGELLVGLNFGPLMTLGAYYVQTQSFSWVPLIAGLPVGFLIAAVLYVNEFPDYRADSQVGKRTLVVRLGRKRAVTPYIGIMAAVYISITLGVLAGYLPLVALLGLATIPLSIRAVQYARKHHSQSFDLVPANAMTVIGHLATGLLLTLAYAWAYFDKYWEGLGILGTGYLAVLAVGFAGFIFYMYHSIERQKDIFLGLKQVVR